MLGRIVEAFVIAEIRIAEAYGVRRPRLHHLRTTNQREVDVIAEYPGGDVIGVEVKAGATPNVNDARHLRWLSDQLGDQFVGGIVFHTGPRSFKLGEKVWAHPIAALWQS